MLLNKQLPNKVVIPNYLIQCHKTCIKSRYRSSQRYLRFRIPEIIPPNSAQSNKSVPANGEAILTSIGKTSVISHANKKYIKTVYMAYKVNFLPYFLSPIKNKGIFNINKNSDNDT